MSCFKNMEDLLQVVSRLVIIIPLIVIVVALFLKFSSPIYKSSNQIFPSPTEIKPTINISPKTKIDLTGPFICQFKTQDASLSAFIKDKKIFANFEEKGKIQEYLLKGDCLYFWNEGNFSGEKICSLTNYINLAGSLMSANFLDMNTIFNYLNQFGQVPTVMKSPANLKYLLDTCKKEEIVNPSVFDLPQNVLFKNKNLK